MQTDYFLTPGSHTIKDQSSIHVNHTTHPIFSESADVNGNEMKNEFFNEKMLLSFRQSQDIMGLKRSSKVQ